MSSVVIGLEVATVLLFWVLYIVLEARGEFFMKQKELYELPARKGPPIYLERRADIYASATEDTSE